MLHTTKLLSAFLLAQNTSTEAPIYPFQLLNINQPKVVLSNKPGEGNTGALLEKQQLLRLN